MSGIFQRSEQKDRNNSLTATSQAGTLGWFFALNVVFNWTGLLSLLSHGMPTHHGGTNLASIADLRLALSVSLVYAERRRQKLYTGHQACHCNSCLLHLWRMGLKERSRA
jgi:hypothetical protein